MPTRLRAGKCAKRELEPEQLDYFLTGTDFCFFWEPPERKRDWRAVRKDLLTDFAAQHPGRRPFFWWMMDAPEPRRQRVGGKGDLVPAYDLDTNLRFGIFRKCSFVDARLLAAVAPVGAGLVVYDPADPPRYESQAAYLKRRNLFLGGEEKRIPPEGWGPEVAR